MGIWCDWQAQGTRITQNLLHDNYIPEGSTMAEGAMMCQDIFIEVGHGPTLDRQQHYAVQGSRENRNGGRCLRTT